MSLGKNIKKARLEVGLSQQQLADKINICYIENGVNDSIGNTAVSNWENDLNKPDADTIGFICKITNVEPNLLLDYGNNNYGFQVQDELDILFSKTKDILTEDDKETIKFLIEKRKREIDKQLGED